jgi:hypothetical protein
MSKQGLSRRIDSKISLGEPICSASVLLLTSDYSSKTNYSYSNWAAEIDNISTMRGPIFINNKWLQQYELIIYKVKT